MRKRKKKTVVWVVYRVSKRRHIIMSGPKPTRKYAIKYKKRVYPGDKRVKVKKMSYGRWARLKS